MTENTDPVLCEVNDRGIASVIFNRPAVNNAYNGEFIATLLKIFDRLAQTELRAIVIKGNGKHFQAGADIGWVQATRKLSPEQILEISRTNGGAFRRLNTMPVPTIALVHGACFGGGTGLIACCDVVIAAESAMFSIAEVRWGLVPTIIIPQLNDAIGLRQVRRYALTGERFNAQEARRIGLVHELVAESELAAAGERIVGSVLANGPNAIAQTKAFALRAGWNNMDEAEFNFLVETHARIRQSAEPAEGLTSFLEKRPARWGKLRPAKD